MMVCMTVLGPPAEVLVVVWGVDMGPLLITNMENGSRFVLVMGDLIFKGMLTKVG